ncbi:hypothetical protein NW754_013064 [Fusarium falciforme]|nr:hypothetical protein NW754_013064 [Fusarium falciforme]
MQFTISAAAFLAFAAKAFAQTADFDPIFKPEAWQSVAAGQSFQITWDAPAKYAGQLVTISLIGGDSQNTQVPIKDIATGVSNDAEAYNWAVDASLGDKNVYGLVIKLESNPEVFQYSNPFKIAGSDKPASEKPTKAAEPTYEAPVYGDDGTATLTAHYGSKTVSVSQVYNAPHTTVVAVEKTPDRPLQHHRACHHLRPCCQDRLCPLQRYCHCHWPCCSSRLHPPFQPPCSEQPCSSRLPLPACCSPLLLAPPPPFPSPVLPASALPSPLSPVSSWPLSLCKRSKTAYQYHILVSTWCHDGMTAFRGFLVTSGMEQSGYPAFFAHIR